ncbi:hypothetical protein A6A19_07435 [Actinobacillus delphinicola]|uniref:hypothetical protein n=1 Tax=Actinobacillus delphinicola TaxID=51161 RepID=UPI002441396C|nr:hypothetical protein [Actinobacillus delphinicola]MDG6897807.1 hypothetical protein [Actinobacillus delphinicola]
MKKALFIVLATSLLAACAHQSKDTQTYRGEVIASQVQGNNMTLTLAKNDCQKLSTTKHLETYSITVPYNSNLVVGSCVRYDRNGQGQFQNVENISRSKSNDMMARTGMY